ncbi:hypothetical protein ACFVUY_21225 [Kitasatospora sp. NPDC058063]|uniref:hypothetical protein n=1 Tax=unclassified Kitasatospora TaxID=2633591 RepID=UPI0036D79034
MSTLRPADGLAARDLDRHLINRAGVIVDANALVQLPSDRLSGAEPFLLATGAPVSATVPAPLLRLLMRAGSIAVPCALVTERLGRHVSTMLAAKRVTNVWSASVSAAEHRDQGTNPYRAAAGALGLPVETCLIIATDPTLHEARTSSAGRLLTSGSGTLRLAAKSTDKLSQFERDVAVQLALGHTYDGVAEQLGCSSSGAANLMSRMMRRRGLTDRTRTIVDLINSGLLDTAELRAALPDTLPRITAREHEVLTLLAAHELSTVARLTGIGQATIGSVITRAANAIGAKTRTQAVIMALLLGNSSPAAVSGSAR